MSTQNTARKSTSHPATELNGVSLAGLADTVHAVQQDSELAKFKFRVANRWLTGAKNDSHIGDFYGTRREFSHVEPRTYRADEPPVLLGEDSGTNPVEFLLAALASCMTTSLAYHAAAEGIELEAVQSNYEGDIDLHGFLGLDPKIRKGFQAIRARFKVKSDADATKLEELVRRSPVFDVITRGTPVEIIIEKK